MTDISALTISQQRRVQAYRAAREHIVVHNIAKGLARWFLAAEATPAAREPRPPDWLGVFDARSDRWQSLARAIIFAANVDPFGPAIPLIREIRAQTGLGLKECKELVEATWR